MYNQCRTPFAKVSLSNWSRYFLTALDLILAIADVFGFSPAVTSCIPARELDLFAALLTFVSVLHVQK